MNLWIVRAGRHGEREQTCLDNKIAALGWDMLSDLSQYQQREDLYVAYTKVYPDHSPNKARVNVGQLWRFAKEIVKGDIIAMPSKFQPVIHFGRVTWTYRYDATKTSTDDDSSYVHQIGVNWEKAIPRSEFEQNLLYSFGSLLTVSQVTRNNAPEIVASILKGEKRKDELPVRPLTPDEIDELQAMMVDAAVDVALMAQDAVIKFIETKFKGHDLTRLIDEILRAEGYITKVSPPGPDGGIDILAGSGPLGFDNPRICVQVKSTASLTDAKTYRELLGVMTKVKADHGLFVSWSGFNNVALKEAKEDFFKVRLWTANDVVERVYKNYDKFSDEFKAELPLKRIWTLVQD